MPDGTLTGSHQTGQSSRKTSLLRPVFAKAVFSLDRRLQKSNGVFCYSSDPKCIFRISLGTLDAPAVLEDGTCLPAGSPIVTLHIWNEHVPVSSKGPNSIDGGLQVARAVARSLRLLSAYLASRPECDDVAAVHGEMALGTAEETAQLLRLCGAYGFISPREGNKAGGGYAHRLGQNILIAMLVLAQNPQAFRLDCLRRDRVRVFMTRAELDKRYGPRLTVKSPL